MPKIRVIYSMNVNTKSKSIPKSIIPEFFFNGIKINCNWKIDNFSNIVNVSRLENSIKRMIKKSREIACFLSKRLQKKELLAEGKVEKESID